MAQVAVVTDSISCLPPDLVQSFNIKIVPTYINYQGRGYRDGIDVSLEEVYGWLFQGNKLPTTSAPPPAAFLEAFKEFSDKSILCITVSSKVSSTFDSAQLAKEIAAQSLGKEDIEVLDSGTACMAEGFLVLRAAQESASGKSLSQVLTEVKKILPKVRMIGMLNTLDYVVRSGKVPKVVGLLIKILDIKTILGISGGEVKLVARAHTLEKALLKMLEIVNESEGEGDLHLAIHYTDKLELAQQLQQRVLSYFNPQPKEIYLTPFSPTMAVAAGPGFVGISFYKG